MATPCEIPLCNLCSLDPSFRISSRHAQAIYFIHMMTRRQMIATHFDQGRILQAYRRGKGTAGAKSATRRRIKQARRSAGNRDELAALLVNIGKRVAQAQSVWVERPPHDVSAAQLDDP